MSTPPSEGEIRHGDDTVPRVPASGEVPSADTATPKIGDGGQHGETSHPAPAEDAGVPDDAEGGR